MPRFDVVIVGGAAVGSATAYFLSAHPGFRGSVLVLEPDPTYTWCATTRSLASVRHQFSTPGNIRMSQFATEFIRHIGEHLAVDGETPDVGTEDEGGDEEEGEGAANPLAQLEVLARRNGAVIMPERLFDTLLDF